MIAVHLMECILLGFLCYPIYWAGRLLRRKCIGLAVEHQDHPYSRKFNKVA